MAGSVPEIEAIKDRETLEAYLMTRPVAEARVAALRCASRVMPLVTVPLGLDASQRQELTVSAFGTLLLSWGLKRYSTHNGAFADARASAALSSAITARAGVVARVLDVAAIAARAISVAANAIRDDHSYAVACASSAVHRASSAANAFGAYNIVAGTVVWPFVRADLKNMYETTPSVCLGLPLWPEGAEPEFRAIWESDFRAALDEFGTHWHVVYEFYQSLRDGGPPFASLGSKAEDVLLSLANEGNDFWERHPDEVMRDLAERLGGRGEPPVSHGEIDGVLENLTQVAADFRFAENEQGAIDAVPFSALARDPGFAGTTLSEARKKMQELADRLKRANAPGRVVRSVTRLLETLPEQLGDLNSALLRSRSRSLEADAIAYGAAGAEAELFPDAVSELLDVVGTLNDLQGCFPAIAEVERNIAAIDIAGREDKVQPELSVISASARELSAQYPHVMTEAAAEAVAALDADIADAADIEVKRDLLARSLLIKRNFLSAVYRKVLSPAGREALRVAKLHYDGAISGSVEGVKKLAASAFPAVVAFYFTGPVGVLAVLLTGQFKSLKDAKDVVDRLKSDGQRSENDQD